MKRLCQFVFFALAFLPLTSAAQSVIPQTGWKLAYVDSQETSCGSYGAANAFDGKAATFWHTTYCGGPNPNLPHDIQINLGATYSLTGFSYLPRQDGCSHGWISKYEFYVSADGANWGTAVAAGTFNYGAASTGCSGNPTAVPAIVVSFPAATGSFVRLRALSEISGNGWSSMAELNVIGAAVTPTTPGTLNLSATLIWDDGTPVAGNLNLSQLTGTSTQSHLGTFVISSLGSASGTVKLDLTQPDPLTFQVVLLGTNNATVVAPAIFQVSKMMFPSALTGINAKIVLSKSTATIKTFDMGLVP
jgi:hypothetical protein